MRIERPAPFLDDGVVLVQEDGKCWVEDPRFAARPWATLWIGFAEDLPPAGWFWLYNGVGNRKTIADCVKHGILEIDPQARMLSDGFKNFIARVK